MRRSYTTVRSFARHTTSSRRPSGGSVAGRGSSGSAGKFLDQVLRSLVQAVAVDPCRFEVVLGGPQAQRPPGGAPQTVSGQPAFPVAAPERPVERPPARAVSTPNARSRYSRAARDQARPRRSPRPIRRRVWVRACPASTTRVEPRGLEPLTPTHTASVAPYLATHREVAPSRH